MRAGSARRSWITKSPGSVTKRFWRRKQGARRGHNFQEDPISREYKQHSRMAVRGNLTKRSKMVEA